MKIHRKNLIHNSLFLLALDYFPCISDDDIYEPVPLQALKEDERLQTSISLSPQDSLLKTIIRSLSEKSEIEISCSDKLNTAGEWLSLSINNKPLLSVMEALWSLNSYKNGMWSWERTTAKPYKYRITRTSAASRLPDLLQDRIDANFLEYSKYVFSLLDENNTAKSEEFSQKVSNEDYVKDVLKATKSAMSESQLKDLLKAEKSSWIGISSLSSTNQQYIKNYWNKLNSRDSQGVQRPLSAIQFYINRSRISPELIVFAGDGQEGSGYSFIGYAQRKEVLKNFISDWQFDGDVFSSPQIKVPSSKGVKDSNILASALVRAAEINPDFSFMAHTPDIARYEKVNQGTDDLLALLTQNDKNNPIWKSRGDIFLMSYPGWFLEDSHINRVPAELFLALKEKQKAKKIDPLSLTDLIAAAQEFPPPALEKYQSKFPQFVFALEWLPLFQWIAANPERLASFTQGVPVEIPTSVLNRNKETHVPLMVLGNGQYYAQYAKEVIKDKKTPLPIDTIHILNSKKKRVLSAHLTMQSTEGILK